MPPASSAPKPPFLAVNRAALRRAAGARRTVRTADDGRATARLGRPVLRARRVRFWRQISAILARRERRGALARTAGARVALAARDGRRVVRLPVGLERFHVTRHRLLRLIDERRARRGRGLLHLCQDLLWGLAAARPRHTLF